MTWRVLPALAWAGLIFFLSSQETLPVILPFNFADKIEHCGVYGILCVLVIFAFRSRERTHLIWAVAITSLYGCSDEIHQMFVPGRSPDVLDWVADSIGALLAVGFVRTVAQRWPSFMRGCKS